MPGAVGAGENMRMSPDNMDASAGRRARWRIEFSREGLETRFAQNERIVGDGVTEQDFRSAVLAEFLRDLAGR
jgi:hypothetical protein